jgi:hypothetical protein
MDGSGFVQVVDDWLIVGNIAYCTARRISEAFNTKSTSTGESSK